MYGPAVKIGELKAGPYGLPGYVRQEDYHEFPLGPGRELSNDFSLREVRQQDHWQLSTMTFWKGGQLIVSDERGKDNSHRTWQVMPTDDKPGRGVVLIPLHEKDTFFRGSRAHAVSPLVLASGLKPIMAHVSSVETFNRVSVAAETGKGWGDVSRWLSLLHNYAFIAPVNESTFYADDAPEILALKSAKDRHHAPGNKMNYRKTGRWAASLAPQWEEFLKSGLKTVECAP